MDGSHVALHEMHKAGRWWLCVQSRPGSSHCNWTWISAGAVQRLDSQGRLLNPDPSLRSRKFHDRDSMKGMFLTPSTADLPMPLLCYSRCREALIPFSPPLPPYTLLSHLTMSTCPHLERSPSSHGSAPVSLPGTRPWAKPSSLTVSYNYP